jgi:predicted Zn-dependent peptidase
MEKERPVVDGEFQRGESDPFFQLWIESQKKLWGEHFTRKNPIGEHDIINTATPEKMMVIKDKYYHPNNSILVITGDVKKTRPLHWQKRFSATGNIAGLIPMKNIQFLISNLLEKQNIL